MSLYEKSLNAALFSYLDTLIWSETLSSVDDDGEPCPIEVNGMEYDDGTPLDQVIDREDLPQEVIDSARSDLEDFAADCVREIGINPFMVFDPAMVGHDFCLSRNGHGAGFFDDSYQIATWNPNAIRDNRGTGAPLEVNDALHDAAQRQGTHGLTVWLEDGVLKVGDQS